MFSSRFRPYAIGMAAFAGGWLVRVPLLPFIGTAYPYLHLYPALFVAAWIGGASSGALVRGDAGRLQQAIWNLVSNAVKFTSAGDCVTITTTATGGHVEIVVSDTGPGIDPAVLPHIFERFRQGDSGTARAHMGLGLGLAIARSLIEAHDGIVTAVSAGMGHGATFTIQLPLLPLGDGEHIRSSVVLGTEAV